MPKINEHKHKKGSSMLKVPMQIAALLSMVIFLVLLGLDMLWEVALMRSLITYLVLMILFYLGVLFLTITRGRRINSDSDEMKEAKG